MESGVEQEGVSLGERGQVRSRLTRGACEKTPSWEELLFLESTVSRRKGHRRKGTEIGGGKRKGKK